MPEQQSRGNISAFQTGEAYGWDMAPPMEPATAADWPCPEGVQPVIQQGERATRIQFDPQDLGPDHAHRILELVWLATEVARETRRSFSGLVPHIPEDQLPKDF